VISSIEITRFRGIREGKLEGLTPLVVLVGPNGCGKSTVLDALLIGASPKTAEAARCTLQRHRGVTPGWRWFAWRANVREPAKITVSTQEGTSRTCQLEFQRGDLARATLILKQEVVPEIRLVEPRVFDGAPPLHQLYTRAVEHGRRNEARAIITDVVPRAKDVEILTEGNTPVVHLVFEDHSVPVAFAGDGVYSLVRLALELASCPEGAVLLEEPEVHEHPAAIRQAMRAVLAAVRRDIQVILTTHSLELIDALLAESSDEDLERLSLYRLQLEDGKLISVRMPGPEVAFSRQQVEDDLR
jgi:predicted ATP-dependent endonuclease of OLD family